MMPQLRFSEFTDAWQPKKIGDVIDHVGGTALEAYAGTKGTYRFISIGNYSPDGKYIDNGQRVELNERTKSRLLDRDDLVMVLNDKTSAGNIIGSTILIDKGGVYIYNQRSERIITKGFVVPGYLWLLLNSPVFRKKVYSVSQGGTQIYVNFSSIKNLTVILPSMDEQEKIADFLTMIEELIVKGERKLGLLSKYKKSVMQKIFSQKIRFNDEKGLEYPRWRDVRLGDMGDVVTGKTPSTNEASRWNGSVLFVTPTDINGEKYQRTSSRTVANSQGGKILPPKSIMYTCIASIGKMSLSVVPTVTNQQINSLIPKSLYENEFIYYALLWRTPKILSMQSSNTLPIINKTEFSNITFSVPSTAEQRKIASFLSHIDQLVANEEANLRLMGKWRQGLLQRMLV